MMKSEFEDQGISILSGNLGDGPEMAYCSVVTLVGKCWGILECNALQVGRVLLWWLSWNSMPLSDDTWQINQ